MRIGIVTPRYPPNVEGGGETSAALLAERLQESERIDDVVVFSFDGRGTERRNGVEVRRLCASSSTVTEWQNVRAYRHLHGILDDFDVVHAYNMELNPTVGALSGDGAPATVATLNSYHFLPKSVSNTTPGTLERLYELVGHPTTGRILVSLMKRVDTFVAISTAVRDVYSAHGFDGDDIEVIPNMLDPSFSVPESTPRANSHDETTLLYVGELSDRKGVSDLVRTLQYLPSDVTLRIVGDGSLADDLDRLAADLDVTGRVTLTGRVPYEEIPDQYASADVFVHPGVWPEPFGRTVLEAMQAGLPVVCTDVGGPADIVTDPDLRCEPRDPEGLANAIERAVAGGPELGARNRDYVREQFAPATVTARIVDLYERVAGRDTATD